MLTSIVQPRLCEFRFSSNFQIFLRFFLGYTFLISNEFNDDDEDCNDKNLLIKSFHIDEIKAISKSVINYIDSRIPDIFKNIWYNISEGNA